MEPLRLAESKLQQRGWNTVAGVDEVGRGALAGPVVAAAVVLPIKCSLPLVRDSKLVSAKVRPAAALSVKQQALAIGLGWVGHDELDQYGLSWAVRQSGLRALGNLATGVDAVILDGRHNYLANTHNSIALVRADQSELCVAAASIVAKVARDSYMVAMDRQYSGFGFASNKGYGSQLHLDALLRSVSPIHRRSFRPLSFRNDLSGNGDYVD